MRAVGIRELKKRLSECLRTVPDMIRQERARLGIPNDPAAYPPSSLRLPDGTAQELIDEDRGER